MSRSAQLWLCLPPAALCALDGGLTLYGQPPEYWSEAYSAVREGNPVAAWFLTLHPLAFAASGVPYLLLLAALIVRLPRAWAFTVSVAVTPAHTFGALTWLAILLDEPALPSVGLLVGASALTLFAGHRCRRAAACPASFSPARGQDDGPP